MEQLSTKLLPSKESCEVVASMVECLSNNQELLEVARQAIEDRLVDLRDSRISVLRNNGLCIKERNSSPSEIIRMGPEQAMAIGLSAIAKHIREQP